jgi:hypothetical protein
MFFSFFTATIMHYLHDMSTIIVKYLFAFIFKVMYHSRNNLKKEERRNMVNKKVVLALRGRGITMIGLGKRLPKNKNTGKPYSQGYLSQVLNGKEPLPDAIKFKVCKILNDPAIFDR